MRFVHGLHGLSWIWKHLPMPFMPMPSNAGSAPSPQLLRASRNGSLGFPLLAPLQCRPWKSQPLLHPLYQLRQRCQLLPRPRHLSCYPTQVKLLSFQKSDRVLVYPHMNSRAYLSGVVFAKSTSLAVSFAITSFSAVAIN